MNNSAGATGLEASATSTAACVLELGAGVLRNAAGQVVPMRPQAWAVLRMLALHPGRVVSKDELLDSVWPGLVVTDSSLAQAISDARAALGEHGHRIIKTVARRGYMLLADPACELRHGAAAASRPGLPAAPETLFGRDESLDELASLIADHRLVTVTGAGGIGKTVVALTVAHRQCDHMADGAAWVELARIADAALLPVTVAQALGLSIGQVADPLPSLLAALKTSALLLVLDNAEHLLAAVAAMVAAAIGAAPRVRVLVTSQAPLHIADEHVFRLGSLDVPPENAAPAEAAGAGAVALFVDRARAVDHQFGLTPDRVRPVIRICRRLDGLPLAIGLAAARLPLFGLAGLETRLDERWKLLAGGMRGAPMRQQTLRAALDWSYGLLAPQEQRLFRQLGVFVGGFTLELAVAACCDTFTDEWSLIDCLGRLVERALVSADRGEPQRYRLLESARDYAVAELTRCGELRSASQCHARAMTAAVRRSAESFWHSPDAAWLAHWAPELGNVRAALAWSEQHDLALWVALAGNAWPLFRLLNVAHELRRRMDAVDVGDALDALDDEVAARYWHSRACLQTGVALGPMHEFAVRAEASARRHGKGVLLYLALCSRAASGMVAAGESSALLAELAQLARDDWPARLRAQRRVAEFVVHNVASRRAEALEAAELGLKQAAEAGALQLKAALANWVLVALLGLGRLDEALARSREMRAWMRPGSDAMEIAFIGTCARCALLQGDIASAKQQFSQMFDLCRTVEWRNFAFFAQAYVQLALADHRFDAAALLLGYATSARERAWGGLRTDPDGQALAALAAAMDAATLERLLAEGECLDEERVCVLVLGDRQSG